MAGVSEGAFTAAQKKLRAALEETAAAHHNEQVTRGRVDAIEGVMRRGIWGRLKWLILGR